MHGSKSSGVTLIELATVITILAILATIAYPSYARFIDNKKVETASDASYNLISLARGSALYSKSTYVISYDHRKSELKWRASNGTESIYQFEPDVKIKLVGFSNSFKFSAKGFAYPDNSKSTRALALVMCSATDTTKGQKITISKTGLTTQVKTINNNECR